MNGGVVALRIESYLEPSTAATTFTSAPVPAPLPTVAVSNQRNLLSAAAAAHLRPAPRLRLGEGEEEEEEKEEEAGPGVLGKPEVSSRDRDDPAASTSTSTSASASASTSASAPGLPLHLLPFSITPPKKSGPSEAEKKIEAMTRQIEEQMEKEEEAEYFGEFRPKKKGHELVSSIHHQQLLASAHWGKSHLHLFASSLGLGKPVVDVTVMERWEVLLLVKNVLHCCHGKNSTKVVER